MGFTYTASALYTQVVQELGGGGVSAAQTTAIQNRIQEGLIDLTGCYPWLWRKQRMDVEFTVSTPYYALPSDFDSMSLSVIYREDTDSVDAGCIVAVTDAEFERNYYSASSGEPEVFRITQREVGATYVPVIEPAPPPDDTYTYPAVEYFCAAPTLSFSAATPINIPTEFMDIWHERALSDAAAVLGMEQKSAIHLDRFEKKLRNARGRRDSQYPKGPTRVVGDPYGDVGALR